MSVLMHVDRVNCISMKRDGVAQVVVPRVKMLEVEEIGKVRRRQDSKSTGAKEEGPAKSCEWLALACFASASNQRLQICTVLNSCDTFTCHPVHPLSLTRSRCTSRMPRHRHGDFCAVDSDIKSVAWPDCGMWSVVSIVAA